MLRNFSADIDIMKRNILHSQLAALWYLNRTECLPSQQPSEQTRIHEHIQKHKHGNAFAQTHLDSWSFCGVWIVQNHAIETTTRQSYVCWFCPRDTIITRFHLWSRLQNQAGEFLQLRDYILKEFFSSLVSF